MLRAWIDILPYFIVKRLAKWLCPAIRVTPKDELILFEIHSGEYLLVNKDKYRKEKEEKEKKERLKREKKLRNARRKIYDLLDEFPELKEELRNALGDADGD